MDDLHSLWPSKFERNRKGTQAQLFSIFSDPVRHATESTSPVLVPVSAENIVPAGTKEAIENPKYVLDGVPSTFDEI